MNRQLLVLTKYKLLSILRDPGTLMGTFVVPVILAFVLGFVFSDGPGTLVLPIAVVQGETPQAYAASLQASERLEPISFPDRESALQAMLAGEALALLTAQPDSQPPQPHIAFDPGRNDARLAAAWVQETLEIAAGRQNQLQTQTRELNIKGYRYTDFFFPGFMALILMLGGIEHIGTSVMDNRRRGILRIYAITPLKKANFFLAHTIAQTLFMSLQLVAYLIVARYFFGIENRGSYLFIWLYCVLASNAFGMIGLAAAAKSRSQEGHNMLMRLITIPMFLLSGVFFSIEKFPDIIQPLLHILPLTPVTSVVRDNLVHGIPPSHFWPQILIISAWGMLGMLYSLKKFEWS